MRLLNRPHDRRQQEQGSRQNSRPAHIPSDPMHLFPSQTTSIASPYE